jgi:hypothetical protein
MPCARVREPQDVVGIRRANLSIATSPRPTAAMYSSEIHAIQDSSMRAGRTGRFRNICSTNCCGIQVASTSGTTIVGVVSGCNDKKG